MKIGSNIRKWRKRVGLSQKALAETLGVSFQAVSAWERDEYLPDATNLLRLRDILQVSMAKIMDQEDYTYNLYLFEVDKMRDFVEGVAKERGYENTLKALPFAFMAHDGQRRKGVESTVFIYHPLILACHLLSLGIDDDGMVAACLLHDVVEDTKYELGDLPVDDDTKDLVDKLTCINLEDRHETMVQYFNKVNTSERAMVIKCIDRCHNLSDMAAGLTHFKQVRMIKESEEFVVPICDELIRGTNYRNVGYLLKYQIMGLLESAKRLV